MGCDTWKQSEPTESVYEPEKSTEQVDLEYEEVYYMNHKKDLEQRLIQYAGMGKTVEVENATKRISAANRLLKYMRGRLAALETEYYNSVREYEYKCR